mgnify:CR=1 FL=1
MRGARCPAGSGPHADVVRGPTPARGKRGRLPVKELLQCRVTGVDIIDGDSFFEMLTGKRFFAGDTVSDTLAKVLREEGFIKNYKFIKDGKQGILRVYLKYGPGQSNAIYGLQRVSKPSRRVYVNCKEIKSVYNGMGIAILSTSRGVMSDKKARQEKVGGEVLCQVW